MRSPSYIDYINGFWRIMRPLTPSISEVALYFIFLDKANDLGWPEWFPCPYSHIRANAAFKKTTYQTALSKLMEYGFIEKWKEENEKPLFRLQIPKNFSYADKEENPRHLQSVTAVGHSHGSSDGPSDGSGSGPSDGPSDGPNNGPSDGSSHGHTDGFVSGSLYIDVDKEKKREKESVIYNNMSHTPISIDEAEKLFVQNTAVISLIEKGIASKEKLSALKGKEYEMYYPTFFKHLRDKKLPNRPIGDVVTHFVNWLNKFWGTTLLTSGSTSSSDNDYKNLEQKYKNKHGN